MKKSVLTYWIAPEEENEFLDFLSSTAPILAYSPEWKNTRELVLPRKLDEYVKLDDPAQLMMAPEGFYTDIRSHDFGGRIRYNVTSEHSALLTYRRGRLIGGKLGQSNLVFYYGVADRPLEADQDLQLWGKAVFRWVKDRTPDRDPTGHYRLSLQASHGEAAGKWILGF